MSFLRILGGMLCLVMAAVLAWPAVILFRTAVLPLLRRSQAEQTHFYILSIGSFSISGWQIVAFELVMVLLALGLVVLAVYAFTAKENEV